MDSTRFDMKSGTTPMIAFVPATVGSSTTTAGAIIDTKGYGAVLFIVALGTRTDGTFTPLIEEGNDSGLSDAVAVDDANLIGTEAAAALTASTTTKSVGYRCGKYRYVRLSFVSSGVTTGSTLVRAHALLGNPDNQPTA